MDIEWIRNALENGKKQGKNRSGLAKALGRNPSAVTALLDGKRALKASEIATVAAYFGIEPPPIASSMVASTIRVAGEAVSEVWRGDTADPLPERLIKIPSLSAWPRDALFGLEIKDRSIDRRALPGQFAACLKPDSAPRGPRNGDWVVVERVRTGTKETTIKQLRNVIDGYWEAWPDSNEPKQQKPLRFRSPCSQQEKNDADARIVGFVVYFFSSATVF